MSREHIKAALDNAKLLDDGEECLDQFREPPDAPPDGAPSPDAPPDGADLLAGVVMSRAAVVEIAAHSQVAKPQKRAEPPANPILTEEAAAIEFANRYGGHLRFDHDAGVWRRWTGAAWQENKTGVAFHLARELARELAGKDDKAKPTTASTKFAKGVEQFARADPVFATTSEYWDRDPMMLGTPGGVVDLRTGRLRRATSEDGITKLTPVAPADKSDCPIWLRFLDEATGDDVGMVRFLKQFCGYSLTGDTREHALLFVFGPGGNGKSVFLNVLTGILGNYAKTATMDAFTASRTDRHTTEIAMLHGARLVTVSETEEGRQWAESRIKQLTGGDPISAHFMRQDNFTFRPQFKLAIVGNHMPSLQTVDEAHRRRFNLVPFTNKPATPDPALEQKLKAEWPAILRWAIEGCLDWQAHRLVRPLSVVQATNEYFDDQDLFGQWLADECDVEPGNPHKWETVAKLYESWNAYANRAGEKPKTKKSFSAELQKKGFARKPVAKARGFSGIRLKLQNGNDG